MAETVRQYARADVAAVLDLRAHGATYEQIRAELGVPISTARAWATGDRRTGRAGDISDRHRRGSVPLPGRVTTNLTAETMAWVESRAAAARIPPSTWLRELLDDLAAWHIL